MGVRETERGWDQKERERERKDKMLRIGVRETERGWDQKESNF